MGYAALAAAAISAAASVYSGVQQGNAADANAKFQQRQYEDSARDELLAGTQEEVVRRRELNDTLSTINAMRSGRGLSLRSPSARAIQKGTIDAASRDIGIAKTNRMVRADANRQSGRFARSVGKSEKSAAMIGGLAKGASTALGGYSDYSLLGG